MNKNMSPLTRRFIRAFGEHEKMLVQSGMDGNDQVSFAFPVKFAYQFADVFDAAYDEFALEELSTPYPADKMLHDFFEYLHLGVPSQNNPYNDFRNERRSDSVEEIWITFELNEYLYLALVPLLQLHELHTAAWERDYNA